MSNIQSAAKRVRTSEERQERNKRVKTRVASLSKEFLAAIAAGDKDVATKAHRAYVSVVDKALKKGVIKAGTANRRKARSTAKLTAL
jgi:small subunit ribosomal protein S20